MSDCPYCVEFATGLPPDIPGVDVPDRLIAESDSFALLVDISPIVIGHMLIVPKRHVHSVAALNEDEVLELESWIASLCAQLGVLAPGLLMEHGSDPRSVQGGCVSHAHLHLVPSDVDLSGSLEEMAKFEVPSLSAIRGVVPVDTSYVYFGIADGRGFVSPVTGDLPRQFVRIELAKAVALPGDEWDWRSHILLDNLLRTVEQVRTRLADMRRTG